MNRRDSLKSLAVSPLALLSAYLALPKNDPNKRMVEVKSCNGWTRTEMKYLKPGDIFRMFDPDGTPVSDKKRGTEFKVIDKPYFTNNVWGVNCE